MSIFVMLLMLSPVTDNLLEPNALAGALWKGTVKVKAEGTLNNRYLANEVNDRDIPTSFYQSVSKFTINFDMELEFLVNEAGELRWMMHEKFDSVSYSQIEKNEMIQEEKRMESGIIAPEEYRLIFKREEKARFVSETSHDQDSFQAGEFNVSHSGSMKKKGDFSINGTFMLVYDGQGFFIESTERVPSKDELPRKQTEGKLDTGFEFPVNLSAHFDHRKKSTGGPLNVNIDVANPFAHHNKGGVDKDSFRNRLKISGTIEMQPLF